MPKSRLSKADTNLLRDVIDRIDSIVRISEHLEARELDNRLRRIANDLTSIVTPSVTP